MAVKNKIELDGKTYVLEGSQPKNSNIKIVVLQRGWVMVGRFTQVDDACSLDDAMVIRTWGTSKGLGELALEGKKTSTKLDPIGHVNFHVLTTVAVVNCNEDVWKSDLA